MVTNPSANAWCWWWLYSSCNGGWSLVCHCRGPGSVTGQSMLYSWWTDWHWTAFSPVLLLSPVFIIPPILHAHSFIYHWHYIIVAADSICFRTYLQKKKIVVPVPMVIMTMIKVILTLFTVCTASVLFTSYPFIYPVSSFIWPHHSVLGLAAGSGAPSTSWHS